MSNTNTTTDNTIFNVGFNDTEGLSKTPAYRSWMRMLERCYGSTKRDSYAGCSVADEWHTFSTFYRWYTEAVAALGFTTVQLDKDILAPNNRVYGPDTCLLVSKHLNTFMVKPLKATHAQGVSLHKGTGKFQATLGSNGKVKHLGYFDTAEEASAEYIRNKRNMFRDLFTSEFEALDKAGLLPEGFTAWGAMKTIANDHWPRPDF